MSPSRIVLTGASGFIGQHFMRACRDIPIRALTRKQRATPTEDGCVEWIVGDLSAPASWQRLLEPGCTVINLAYPRQSASADAEVATRAMVKACADAGVARLIHCSTISVFGRTSGGVIDENTPCRPLDDYGRKKLLIEHVLRATPAGEVEIAVVRPAAVFGVGGQALHSLRESLSRASRLVNYGRSSLFGCRRMHLVPVEDVVAALRFLCTVSRSVDREVFIVAEDDDPLNNFRDVEAVLMAALHQPGYPFPPLPLPSFLLKGVLWARRRSEIDPSCRYSMAKLRSWGFVPPVGFSQALQGFAQYCCAGRT